MVRLCRSFGVLFKLDFGGFGKQFRYSRFWSLRRDLLFQAMVPTVTRVVAPPEITEGTTPSRRAMLPDSNAPISLDEPMNMLLTADTRPFMCSGVRVCSERAADDHADAVEHSTHGEKEERDPKIGRQRKQNHAHAEAGHTGKQYAAHVFAYRVVRYINSHKHGTYAGRGAEKAKTGSAYVQHHVGKVGQQCDGAAEQYGKKIERNGAQDKLIAEHKAQTLAYLFARPLHIVYNGGKRFVRDHKGQQQTGKHEGGIERIGRRYAHQAVDKTTERRPTDGGNFQNVLFQLMALRYNSRGTSCGMNENVAGDIKPRAIPVTKITA